MLDEHQYSIDLILFEAVPTFKLNTLLRKVHYEKSEGDPVTKILALMMMLSLMLLNSVNSFYHSRFRQITQRTKRCHLSPEKPSHGAVARLFCRRIRRHTGNLRHTVDDRSVFPGDEAAFATRSVPISRFRCTNCARHDLLYFLYLSGQLSARQCLPTLRHAV